MTASALSEESMQFVFAAGLLRDVQKDLLRDFGAMFSIHTTSALSDAMR
jgi:hypothetical protein